ncbi:MAG: energy-coupling factor transporter transmembrane protein EcfT [Clostridiales bacterium]|nr:energy-coupling factor transporter transmembrane protein EcfT [Clostridiales bacterium]
MFENITLGQYYPGNSLIHQMDPRAKILLTILFMVMVFLVPHPIGYLIPLCYILLIIKISHIPFSFLLKGLKSLRFILLFTFILNLFFSAGSTVLVKFWFITLTKEGLLNAIHFSLRLIFLLIGTSLLTLSTPPVALTDGIELLLSPLRVIRFPAHELALMMTIALRFIPDLMQEANKIMKAQMARGADFESGNIIARAKAMIPLLVPLFVSAFRRAGDLSMAMEARCYHGSENRTRLRVLKLSKIDWIASMISLLFLAAIIVERRLI